MCIAITPAVAPYIVAITLGILLLPWLAALLIAVLLLPVFPILSYFKVGHLDRAVLFCIGPVGFNGLVCMALSGAGLFFAVLKFTGMVDRAKARFNEAIATHEALWRRTMFAKFLITEAVDVYSDWGSYGSALRSGLSSLRAPSDLDGPCLGDAMLLSASVSTAALLCSVCLLSGLMASRGSECMAEPIEFLRREGSPLWLRVMLGVIVSCQLLLEDTVQAVLAVASPFLIGSTWVPDLVLYSGLFSAFSFCQKVAKLRGVLPEDAYQAMIERRIMMGDLQ